MSYIYDQKNAMMYLPNKVKLVEVGPRDGLQNESRFISTNIKIEFINLLSETGLSVIECTSFVSPKWVPQLADAELVLKGITQSTDVIYPVLVPNIKGFHHAIAAGATHIAVFTAASETFCQKNTHCTITESLDRAAEIITLAKQHNILVRGYISCVLGCPYEGNISAETVAVIAKTLWELGCYEISLGDTIGIGTAKQAQQLIHTVAKKVPVTYLAAHFHDTYGQALANLLAVMQCGVATIDSSVGGLGGCPYAKGASGNVATEDVLFMLNGLQIETNVNLKAILHAGNFISNYLRRETRSKVALAMEKYDD